MTLPRLPRLCPDSARGRVEGDLERLCPDPLGGAESLKSLHKRARQLTTRPGGRASGQGRDPAVAMGAPAEVQHDPR
jgi:hypothetical protein